MWRRQRPASSRISLSVGASCGHRSLAAGEREERVVERRLAERDLVDRDAGVLERVEHGAQVAAGRPGAGTDSRRARTSSSGSRRSNSARGALRARRRRGASTCTRRSPTRAFSSAGVPAATVRPSAQHDDLVGEPVGLLEVLGGEHERGAVGDQALDRAPHLGPAARGRARSSARRGRRPAAARPGRPRGRAGGACRRSRCRPGGRRRGRSRSGRAARRRARPRRPWRASAGARAGAGSRARSGARRARPAGRRARPAARTAPGSRTTSWPATNARPAVGASSVVRMRTAVVLPAPLWPSRPSTVPGSTARSRLAQGLASRRSACRRPFGSYSVRHRTAYGSGTLYGMSSEEPPPPIWARPEPRGRGRAAALSRKQIVDVALSIADEEGLEAVSMRRLARELRSGAMSIYHYFDSRDELLDLMGDTVAAEMLVPASCRTTGARRWRRSPSTAAQAFLQPPVAAADAAGAPAVSPTCCATSSSPPQAVSRWSSAASTRAAERRSSLAVDDYTIGFTLRERTRRPRGARRRDRRGASQEPHRRATCSRAASSRCSSQFLARTASRRRTQPSRTASTGCSTASRPSSACNLEPDGDRVRREGPPHPRLSGRGRLRAGGPGRDARLQRVAVPADPGRGRGGHEGADRAEPLPGPDERGAAHAGCRDGHGVPAQPDRDRQRLLRHPARRRRRAAGAGRRARLRVAVASRLPAPGGGVRRPGDRGPARRRPPPRPRTDARGDHRRDAARDRLQPEQPDLDGAAAGRDRRLRRRASRTTSR